MTFNITVSCQKSELGVLRNFITTSLSQTLDEKAAILFSVAVEEICMNVMSHSHSYNSENELDIKLNITDSEVNAEIIDESTQVFDIVSYNPPEISQVIKEKRRGSMGLMLVKRICDSVSIETFHNGGGLYRLTKRLA